MKMKPTLPALEISYILLAHAIEVGLTPNVWEQSFIFGEVGNETLDCTTNHGVLAHQDDGLISKGSTDFVHLLRTDIVDGDDEN